MSIEQRHNQEVLDIRRKIARRKRRKCLRMGSVIEQEGWIKEPDWERKDIGYGVIARYNGWRHVCSGYDELEAYNILLWSMTSGDEPGPLSD